jgi:DNA-binding transcriptional LysR family regulator
MLNGMVVFVRTVELKSISAAARELNLSPAGASSRIMQLEREFGVKLLNRTTRTLGLTEAGFLFYRHAREVLAAVEKAKQSLAGFYPPLTAFAAEPSDLAEPIRAAS